jgi:hypothetical protein
MAQSPEPSAEVAAILEQLRAEVRARRLSLAGDEESSATRHAIERQLQRAVEQLEITRVVSAHWPLESRSLFERGLNFVHKLVRRFLRWYINPIVEQQNAFNDTTARTLRLLAEGYSELLHQGEGEPGTGNREPGTENGEPATENREPGTGNPPPDAPIHEWQALVDQRGQTGPSAFFPELALQPYRAQLVQCQQVHAHWPLQQDSALQRVAALVQKLTRFYLRWLINPIVEQQNSFNAAVTEAIDPLLNADAEVRTGAAAQRARRANPDR